MKRIIKKGAFPVVKAFLLISSCFMMSNLWTMEGDEYKRATLVNKTESQMIVSVYFSSDRANLGNAIGFEYTVKKGDTRDIRIKDEKGIIGVVTIFFWDNKKGVSTQLFLNAVNREDIKAGKTYDITWVEKTGIIPKFKEVIK